MARCYEFMFVSRDDGDVVEQIGYGNTRKTAERSARRKLRNSNKDPTQYYTRATRHVSESERARTQEGR